MAFSGGSMGSRGRIAATSIAEINVTPLVDVMLVLLVIFMAASAIESARLSREAETLRQVATDEAAPDAAAAENQVPVDLPKAKADKVRRGERSSKPTLSFDRRERIWLGKRQLANCKSFSGKFEACLDEFEKNLQATASAEQLREVRLRADRRISYGRVLALMARMRRAGITHFGLITSAPVVVQQ